MKMEWFIQNLDTYVVHAFKLLEHKKFTTIMQNFFFDIPSSQFYLSFNRT